VEKIEIETKKRRKEKIKNCPSGSLFFVMCFRKKPEPFIKKIFKKINHA